MRVTEMTNSVNTFEVMVKSVSDNQVGESSVSADSAGIISSFRSLGLCLKLS